MEEKGHTISDFTLDELEVGKQRSLEKMHWRNEKREEKRYILHTFLESHKFGKDFQLQMPMMTETKRDTCGQGGTKDVNEPRIQKSCFLFSKPKEVFYPLHKAAQLGDAEIVRLLLAAGADREQRTSKGRTAEMIALEEDLLGSHKEVLMLLASQTLWQHISGMGWEKKVQARIKVMPLREAIKLMEEQKCL